jgi:hypothetical protein
MMAACMTCFDRGLNLKEKCVDAGISEETQRTRRHPAGQFAEYRLTEGGDFLVEMGEGGFERFAMVGMSGGSEIVHHAGTRKLKVLAFLFALELFRSFGS